MSILKITEETSVINRILVPCLFGLLLVGINMLAMLISLALQSNVDYFQNGVINSFTFFITGSYGIAIFREEIHEKIMNIIYPCCRKIISSLKYWFCFLFGWYFFIFLRAILISQFPTYETLLTIIMVYWLYIQLFSLFIYSLAVFIPIFHYLSSGKKDTKERKGIANYVTFLTPLLGIPWIYLTYVIWSFSTIPDNYSWLLYIVIFAVYIGLFFVFIDFPYYAGTLDKKRTDLKRNAEKRNDILENLNKMGNDAKEIMKKILLENKIARLDREKQFIESRSLHPYKLIIPSLSLVITIIVALVIEWFKTFLPNIGG